MPRLILLFFFSAAVTWVLSRLLLRGHNSGAIIKDELLATQKEKEGTPVVGGIAFGLSTLVVGLFDSVSSALPTTGRRRTAPPPMDLLP